MIDSTNPRILADNIRHLDAKTPGTVVTPNPEGEAVGDLNSLGIGSLKYIIPSYTPVGYSTLEVDTGMTWIDGSEIYQKTIEVTGITATDHNISDIDKIIGCECILIKDSGASVPFPTFNTWDSSVAANSYYAYIVVTRTAYTVYASGSNWIPDSSNPAYLTIRYTKAASEAKSKKSKK